MKRFSKKIEKGKLGLLLLLMALSTFPGLSRFIPQGELNLSSSSSSRKKVIEDCFDYKGKSYDCNLRTVPNNKNKTVINLDYSSTEADAKTCEYCKIKFRINKNIKDLEDLDDYLMDIKDEVRIAKSKESKRKRRLRDNDDVDSKETDPIWYRCSHKKRYSESSEKYLRCAVLELKSLVRSKSDKYDPEDFHHLFMDHIREGMLRGLSSKADYKRREFERLHRDLLSSLREYDHYELRKELLDLKSQSFIAARNNVTDILHESNRLAQVGQFQEAFDLLNQFGRERLLLTNRMQNGVYSINEDYINLVLNNPSFSRIDGMNELNNHFIRPVYNTYQSMWSPSAFPIQSYASNNPSAVALNNQLRSLRNTPIPEFSMNRGDPRSGSVGSSFQASPLSLQYQNGGVGGQRAIGQQVPGGYGPPYSPNGPHGWSNLSPTGRPMATNYQQPFVGGPGYAIPAATSSGPGYLGLNTPTPLVSTGINNLPNGHPNTFGQPTGFSLSPGFGSYSIYNSTYPTMPTPLYPAVSPGYSNYGYGSSGVGSGPRARY